MLFEQDQPALREYDPPRERWTDGAIVTVRRGIRFERYVLHLLADEDGVTHWEFEGMEG